LYGYNIQTGDFVKPLSESFFAERGQGSVDLGATDLYSMGWRLQKKFAGIRLAFAGGHTYGVRVCNESYATISSDGPKPANKGPKP
jgi:hypothetical protein